MELRDYAISILEARTLSGKLLLPLEISDHAPGPALKTPFLERPPELKPSSARHKLFFNLETPHSRAQTLHGFANHELLAIELMALALLKFPDAPASFRRGLLKELGEEQLHLSLYLERMKAGGVAFGELPVNDFFWRSCADAESPYAFILRLALVFEQANLDFSEYYRQEFLKAGDPETAAVLQRVHQDEAGHVKFGLHWFRAWKNPLKSDWEAFESSLEEPLGPSRAKGPVFLVGVREQLGFETDFLSRLELWSRSRGRPPSVWVMNACCEEEVARGTPGYTPSATLQALNDDLAPILIFLASREDLVEASVTPAFLKKLQSAGFELPEVIAPKTSLQGRKLGRFSPWGWSPTVAMRFRGLECSMGRTGWEPALADAFGKDLAVRLRARLPGPEFGTCCTTVAETRLALTSIEGMAVIKARFKSSGRNVLHCQKELPLSKKAWLDNLLSTQGLVVVEPWLERVLDLSFHFELDDAGRMRFLGTIHFETTPDGRFLSATAGRYSQALPAELVRFLHGEGKEPRKLPQLARQLGNVVGPALRACGYSGPVGIDAMVYRQQGQLFLCPLVEINPRWSFGRLALALTPRIHPHSLGKIRLQKLPYTPADLELKDGFLYSGALLLGDPAAARSLVPVLELMPLS